MTTARKLSNAGIVIDVCSIVFLLVGMLTAVALFNVGG